MTERISLRNSVTVAAAALVMLALSGCQSPDTNASANVNKSNEAQLFTIPPDQMSHVQVVKVRPTTLTRTLRLT